MPSAEKVRRVRQRWRCCVVWEGVLTMLTGQDYVAKTRLKEIKANPLIGRSEKELETYLAKRGVKVVKNI